MNKLDKRHNIARIVSVLVTAIALSAGTLIPAGAQVSSVPTIAFLNPSGFSERPGVGTLVSDNKPTRPSEGSGTYRLVAWTGGAPDDAGVEFELLKNGVSLDTIDADFKLEGDTYEANWNIPDSLPDGPYTLRATLFSNNEAIANVDETVIINRFAERTEITYPAIGSGGPGPVDGSFGTYAPLATSVPEEGGAERRLPIGNIDGNHTGLTPGSGTSYVRVFYSVSAPGEEPEWTACGTQGAPGSATLSSAANDGVRCTLEDPAHQTMVTAVAAVANNSQGAFDPSMNGAGDAVRVLEAYGQTPSALNLSEGSTQTVVEAGDDGSYGCHVASAILEDERGREVLGANIDIHATGPNDKLRFDTGLLSESGLQAPDRHVQALEPGYDCFAGSTEGEVLDQAEHQILGGPDVKHIESDDLGTEDDGLWAFALWTPKESVGEKFTAHFTMWVDEADDGCTANDDRFTDGELSVAGSVGFGTFPEPAQAFPSTPLTPCIPPAEGPALRTISLFSEQDRAENGEAVTVTGTVSSAYIDCVNEENVKIKWRRPGRRFTKVVEVTTDADGSFSATVYPKRGQNEYRSVAPLTETCMRARSDVVSIQTPRR